MSDARLVRRWGSGVVHLATALPDVVHGKILGTKASWSEKPVQALCGVTLRPPVVLMATNKGLCRPCGHAAAGQPAPATKAPRPRRRAAGGTTAAPRAYRCHPCGEVFASYAAWERHSDASGHRRMELGTGR